MHEPIEVANTTAENRCGLGKGTACCSYLAMRRGFVCLKGTQEQATIDERRQAGTMNAKSDNCTGFPLFKPIEQEDFRRVDGVQ